jgi:hypothetical protein
MRRFLFIRDDGRNTGDMFPAIEDFIRNVRAHPSEDTWAAPLPYRLPHRYNDHMWKLVRNLTVKDDTPHLAVLNRNSDQFNLTPDHFSLSVKDVLDTVDCNYAGAAFLVVYPSGDRVISCSAIQCARWAVKDEDGWLVDWKTGERFSSGEKNDLCTVILSVFRMGDLPIYAMFLNNDLLINKVWFRNLNESDEIVVFGENTDLKTAIFSPTPDPERFIQVNDTLLMKSGIGGGAIDLFGTREWQGVLERQEDGSEITLDGFTPPSLKGMVDIDTDLPFQFDGRTIRIHPPERVGYLKINIKAGPFFRDFGHEMKWEYIIARY